MRRVAVRYVAVMAPSRCSPGPGLTGLRRRAQSAAREESRLSRLDSNIRRLEAQRALPEHGSRAASPSAGAGDRAGAGQRAHLRPSARAAAGPGDLRVRSRQVGAHPDCIPDSEHLLLGEIRETLPGLFARMPGPGGAGAQRSGHGRCRGQRACSPRGWHRLRCPCCSKAPGWFPIDLFKRLASTPIPARPASSRS